MSKTFLRVMQPVNNDADMQIITQFLPEISSICANKTRAGILYLLINSPETMHSMKVEEISFKLGIRQPVCIHHLERLNGWKLVDVKKSQKYGDKNRRSIWGLDLRYPNWILECYKNIRSFFFTEKELNEITGRNINTRSSSTE